MVRWLQQKEADEASEAIVRTRPAGDQMPNRRIEAIGPPATAAPATGEIAGFYELGFWDDIFWPF
jgi:hypothetical protein